MPVTVIIETAGRFKHTVYLGQTWLHIVQISAYVLESVFKAPFFLLRGSGGVVTMGIEGRVDVYQVNTVCGEVLQLCQAVAAVNSIGFHEFYFIIYKKGTYKPLATGSNPVAVTSSFKRLRKVAGFSLSYCN